MISIPKAIDERGAALRIGNFAQIGGRGLGDGHNSYAYSAAWFRDHLYIGSNRDALAMLNYSAPFKFSISGDGTAAQPRSHFQEGKANRARSAEEITPDLQIWPVPVPEDYEELDRQGEIWRYSPEKQEWRRVYRAPLTEGSNGKEVPLAYGFRNMCVFQGRGDREPALYTVPMCGRFTPGPVMLRSEDGESFEPLDSSRHALSGRGIGSYRGIVSFKGRLFVAPSGSHKGGAHYVNMAPDTAILCTDDPIRGEWAESSPRAFGDPTNMGAMDMAVCGDHLYVGTVNVERGCQLWKTDGEGPPPHRWTKVLDNGADRGPFNQVVLCFSEFQGSLYLGTAIQNGGFDRIHNVGPAAAEVLRIHPDDSWDLVVGQARLSRSALKTPRSGMGPGFDNPFCGYIWRMCSHEGALYVGTYDSSIFLNYSDRARWDSRAQRIVDEASLDRFLQGRGGCELWCSTDGDNWSPVTRNGFGAPFNIGVRALLSTPIGLVVGTANPFGPQAAVRGPSGWRFEENRRGGFEVWLGQPAATALLTTSQDIYTGLRSEGRVEPPQLLNERLSGMANSSPAMQSVSLADSVLSFRIAGPDHVPAGSGVAQDPQIRDCLLELTSAEAPNLHLESLEDEVAAYFGESSLRCVGYWTPEVQTPAIATARQVHELLAMLTPASEAPSRSLARLLLVAPAVCNPLADLAAMLPLGVTCVWTTPEAVKEFVAGQAPFDAAISIEALAEHSLPRLQSVVAAVRPGGAVALADFLGSTAPDGKVGFAARLKNDYEQRLLGTGLEAVSLSDETRRTWLRFYQHSRRFFMVKELFHQIDADRRQEILSALPGGVSPVAGYIIARARKPLR